MKSTSTRRQLNEYFAAELAELRTSAIEFSAENPSIAEELSLNKHNEGKSQDPHIEMLIQSFAWMTSRLRQNIESESTKLPSMLLQQLYPQLLCSVPSMAIAECHINGFAANFADGYLLNGRQHMEPLGVTGTPEEKAKLNTCKMSTCFDSTLWPFVVNNVKPLAINDFIHIAHRFHRGQSIINIDIAESDKGAATDICLHNPLRFFINLEEQDRFSFYEFIARHFEGAILYDDKGTEHVLSANQLKLCGFSDDERLLPASIYQDLGFSLLQDYFNFPEKFMFFELTDLSHITLNAGFSIKLVFNEALPKSVHLLADSLKLNCIPVINLFEKTSEPIPLTNKNYRYRLFPNREHYDCHEILKVKKVYSVNKRGENKELLPYFCLSHREQEEVGYRWLVQQEINHKKSFTGTESWLSVYDENFAHTVPIGDTIYAETFCCNRSQCELLPKTQRFSIIGSSPVTHLSLITRPTRHRSAQIDSDHMWKLLSHLSIYYVSLTDPVLAKDTLITLLELYANDENSISQRQISSIEKLETEDDVQANIKSGWRGYYAGTKFTLTLTERKFDGSSPLLFGRVLHQFLALFCHINSFVRLELKFGNRSIYQWEPMSGHKVLV